MKITKMRLRRMKMGLTQSTLAYIVGVTQPRISAWENCRADIPAKRREEIAYALGIPADELTDEA